MLGDVTDPGVWTDLDAWILLCVPGRPGGLRVVLSTADHYNHAIPREEELAVALARLVASGLVLAQDDRVAATTEGLAVLARAHRQGYERIPEVRALLQGTPRRHGPAVVSQSSLERAYRNYGNPWWRRLWRRYA